MSMQHILRFMGLTAMGLAGMALLVWSALAAAGTSLKTLPAPVPAPAFELTAADTSIHKLAGYRGKVLVVNFWATWCPPCVKEMPALERAWQTLQPAGVELVAINFGDDAGTVQAFARQHELTLPLLLDPQGQEAQRWPMRGLPATFVLDRDGRIVYSAQGEREWDHEDILSKIRKLAAVPWKP